MKTIRSGIRTIWALLVVGVMGLASAYAANPELEAELEHYKKVFEGDDFTAQRAAIGDLPWTGISDEAVYDPLARKLREGTNPPPNDREDEKSDRLAWYAKGLGVSGNPKYRPLLEELSGIKNEHISLHAENALRLLDRFSKVNPYIREGLEEAEPGRTNERRAENMLTSGVPELIRAGGKRIYYHLQGHPELTATAEQVLLEKYKNPRDNTLADALAWLCKALSAGEDPQYLETLKTVWENTGNGTVEGWCEKSWVILKRKVGEPAD